MASSLFLSHHFSLNHILTDSGEGSNEKGYRYNQLQNHVKRKLPTMQSNNVSGLSLSAQCQPNLANEKAAITDWIFGRQLLGKAQWVLPRLHTNDHSPPLKHLT